MSSTLDATRLAAARLRAADALPFLAMALYALTPVAAPGTRTFAVDERWRLFVDPEALEGWSVEEVAGVLLHEVSHLVRDHAGRARTIGVGRETAPVWNIAADAEINDDLVADGVVLPSGGITPKALRMPPGHVAEHYYDRLLRRPPTIEPPSCGTGCTGQGDGHPGIGHDLPSGLDEGEVILLRLRVAQEVERTAAAQPGTVGGGWTRWAEALLRPVLDWRRLLSGQIRGAVASITGRADYTYARPSRRRVPAVVLPSLHRPLPAIAIVVDTSASVTDEQLSAAWAEVQGCLSGVGVRRELVRVYATDAVTVRVADIRRRRADLRGGGGTDMGDGIAVALRARPRPGLVVVLTDGYTPWPARAPGCRVVVGLFETGESPFGFEVPATPPWATPVVIPSIAPAAAAR